jgi:protein-tyrosine-phosphatase
MYRTCSEGNNKMIQPIWRKSPPTPGVVARTDGEREWQPDWPSVLFVCTANRIRSPLAEYLLLDQLQRRGELRHGWRVESAGVWTQDGLPVLDAVLNAGEELGLDLSAHRSRAITSFCLKQFDLVIAMERKHAATIVNEFPHMRNRVLTLGEIVSGYAFDIVDPPRHTPRAIRATARELAEIIRWGLSSICDNIVQRRSRGEWQHIPPA